MSPFATEVALHWAAVACYIAGSALLAHAVFFDHPARARYGLWAALAGLVLHGAAIGVRWTASGHGPYMLRHEILSSDAWIAVAVMIVALWNRPRRASVGMVVLPAAVLLVGLGLMASPGMKDLPPSLRSMWLVFHVLFAKLAAGAFLLSVGSAAMLLVRLRQAPARLAARLPPEDMLDALTVRFIGFGFFFWTVNVGAGAIWANQSWGRYWGWDPVETWSLITWLLYGTFLHARLFFRLRGRGVAWAAIACFALAIGVVLLLPFFSGSLHASYFQ